VLAALTLRGIDAVMTIEGGTSGDVFTAFVGHVLVPTLRVGDVVVLDNLGAHKVERARELIERAGARVLFLPPYHPDLNPIELAWSKIKALLRTAEARTHAALDAAIASAVLAITPSDAVGYFGGCGYHVA
jgi:transposase